MKLDDRSLLTDRNYLTKVQYRTHANLAARQSSYAYQCPKIDLASAVVSLAGLAGGETVADIGCGNGAYLAELARVTDVTLAPHMLYHVPDRRPAVREFRRVTRPGGLTLVVLNASDHLAELQDLVEAAVADIGLDAGPGRCWATSPACGSRSSWQDRMSLRRRWPGGCLRVRSGTGLTAARCCAAEQP